MSNKKAFHTCQILFRKGEKTLSYLDALKGILFLEKCFFRKKINMDKLCNRASPVFSRFLWLILCDCEG